MAEGIVGSVLDELMSRAGFYKFWESLPGSYQDRIVSDCRARVESKLNRAGLLSDSQDCPASWLDGG